MLATEILGSAVARSWRSLLLVGVWRYGMLKLLRRRLRGSARVVGVDDLALAEGVVLGIFGHGEDGKCQEDGGSQVLSIGRACAGLRSTWGTLGSVFVGRPVADD